MEEGPGREEGREGPTAQIQRAGWAWEITGRATPTRKRKGAAEVLGRDTPPNNTWGEGRGGTLAGQEKAAKSKLRTPKGRGSTVGYALRETQIGCFFQGSTIML